MCTLRDETPNVGVRVKLLDVGSNILMLRTRGFGKGSPGEIQTARRVRKLTASKMIPNNYTICNRTTGLRWQGGLPTTELPHCGVWWVIFLKSRLSSPLLITSSTSQWQARLVYQSQIMLLNWITVKNDKRWFYLHYKSQIVNLFALLMNYWCFLTNNQKQNRQKQRL